MKLYATFEQAQRRVTNLKAQGVWPGIAGPDKNGMYRLTYDPGEDSDA